MLITFKSKAGADVLMLRDLAQTLLGMMGRQLTERGIFTHEQLPDLIAKLESSIKVADKNTTGDIEDSDEDLRDHLGMAQRAFPLLDLMRAANKAHEEVMWGV